MENKRNVTVAVSVLLLAAAMTAGVLIGAFRKGDMAAAPTAEILGSYAAGDFDVTIDIGFANTELTDTVTGDGVILGGAFRNLKINGVEKKDGTTVSIKTAGKLNRDRSVGYVTLPPELTVCGETLTAQAEIDMSAVNNLVQGMNIDFDNLSKQGAKALITAGIGKIPYVGGGAAKTLGPILSDMFGLKRDATLDDVLEELDVIKAQLNDLSAQIEDSTQSILNRMFLNDSFGNFDSQVSQIATVTADLYADIYRISNNKDTSEAYKTFKVAELLDFGNKDISDYVNSVKTAVKYLDGSQTSILSNKKGIFENAFLSGCDGSVLGGEAAMRVGPYLNQVSGVLGDSFKGMAVVLEAKLYISENYDTIKEKAANDPDLLRLLDSEAEKEYLDPDNIKLWEEALSEKNETGITYLHNRYFGEGESEIGRYNALVKKRWFSYIRKYTVSDRDVSVEFSDLGKKIVAVKPTEIGLNWNAAKASTENNVINVNGKLSDELHVAVTKAEIENIIGHIIKNENNVFLSYEPEDGLISVDDKLLDMLESYGFEVERFDDGATPLFICSSSGKYTKTPIYDVSPNSRHIGDDYFATLAVRGYDCGTVHGYNTATGASYTDAVWNDVKYYDYYYKFMTGKTEKSKQQDYVFYYFAPADVEIADKSDLISLMDSVASGSTYEGKTVNLVSDIDMSKESYAHIWDGRSGKEFRGTLNGNGHKITGLTESTANSNGGLFAVLGEGANVNGLTLENFNISGTGSGSGYGALAGSVNGYVRVAGVRTDGGSVSGKDGVGGIIGTVRSGTLVIKSCENTASVTASGKYAGGVIGSTVSKQPQNISSCRNSGSVTALSSEAAGGIVGYMANDSQDQQHTVEGNKNGGNVASGTGAAGGIIGHLDTDSTGHKIQNNENTGAVISTGSNAGGVVGYSEGGGKFVRNNNSGAVKGTNAGGILGGNEDDGIDFSGSVNSGKITGTTNAGGIAGYLGNNDNDKAYTATGCVNTGRINAPAHAGGIVGHLDTDSRNHVFTDNINSADVTSTGDSGGIVGYSEGGGTFTGNGNQGIITGKLCGGVIGSNEDDGIDFSGSVNEGVIKATSHAGGILGYTGTRKLDKAFIFDGCVNKAAVSSESGYAGGIVGDVASDSHGHSFAGCNNTAEITGHFSTGGIVGKMEGGAAFTDCENSGAVVSGTTCAAGICAYVVDDGCTFSGCKNTASVTGAESCGGIAGEIGNKDNDPTNKFTNCENSGSVVSSAMNAGGIVGMLRTDSTGHVISGCVNGADVKGSTTAGGIIGYMYGGGTFERCVNSGSVTTENDYVGGTVGRIEDDTCKFTECTNTGTLTGNGDHKGQTCGYDGKRKTTY